MTIYIGIAPRLLLVLSLALLAHVSPLLVGATYDLWSSEDSSLSAVPAGSLDPELARIANEYEAVVPPDEVNPIEDDDRDDDDSDSNEERKSDEEDQKSREEMLSKAADAVSTLCQLNFRPRLLNVFEPPLIHQFDCSVRLNLNLCDDEYRLPSRCCGGKERNFMCLSKGMRMMQSNSTEEDD